MKRSHNKPLPSQDDLHHLFDYDSQSGRLLWRNPPLRSKSKSGDIAGTLLNNGYRAIKVGGCPYLAHRLVWMWFYGEDPKEFEIDHIDQDKDNNRTDNLCKVDRLGNARNLPSNSRSKLGIRGVSQVGRRFIASVRYNGSDLCKTFYSLEEALQFKSQMEDQLWK